MILRRLVLILLILSLLVTVCPTQLARAARGVPGSAEFAFAAHLSLSASSPTDAVHLASNLELDWLALDCSWKSISPTPSSSDWSSLSPTLLAASRAQLPVMLSLSQAPDWALSSLGPDPSKTAQFALQLVLKFPIIRAIELFPAPNTSLGWGKLPNPQAYAATWKAVLSAFSSAKLDTLIVVGGLLPVNANSNTALNDLSFLQELYSAAKTPIPVIAMQAANLTGDPLLAPDPSETRVLRHYEQLRAVMLKNKQDAGLIWITRLSPPNASLAPNDRRFLDPANQALWWGQAFEQLKSQLYIGAAFLSQINPGNPDAPFSLILPSSDYHPFYRPLRDLIAVNRSNGIHARPGREKNEPLQKNEKGKK